MRNARAALAAACLCACMCAHLCACAATRNPTPTEVKPATPPPRPSVSARAEQQVGAAQAPTPAPAPAAAPAAAPAEAAPPGLVIGSVGGEQVDASALLERLWMRDSQTARELFEFLAMSRIALFEADRLGVRIDPLLVDDAVARTLAAVTERLKQGRSGLTLDQHVQRNLEITRANYDRKVRADAVLQLLTERCVRAWYLENPRVEIQLGEFETETALEAAQTALAAGEEFDAVVRAHGLSEDALSGGMRMTIVRNEQSDLARLAFVTPLGEVGGPLVRENHYLLVRPVQRAEPVEGSWAEVGVQVEASLKVQPLDSDKMEYVQWRAAMVRRYPVDFVPFLELVTATSP